MIELWKEIPGYDGFQVTNTNKVKKLAKSYTDSIGRVVNKPEKLLTVTVNRKGYLRVELCIGDGKKKSFTLHRLIMLAFKGLPPAGMDQINHIDGNKQNNNPDNLEYSNNSLNIAHAWRTGLFKPNLPKGLNSPHAVILVHSEYGIFKNILEVSAETGINRGRISRMINKKITNTLKYIQV